MVSDIRPLGTNTTAQTMQDNKWAQSCAGRGLHIARALMVLERLNPEFNSERLGREMWASATRELSPEALDYFKRFGPALPFAQDADKPTVDAAVKAYIAEISSHFVSRVHVPPPSKPVPVPPGSISWDAWQVQQKLLEQLKGIINAFYEATNHGDEKAADQLLSAKCKDREALMKALREKEFTLKVDRDTRYRLDKAEKDSAILFVSMFLRTDAAGEHAGEPRRFLQPYHLAREGENWRITQIGR